MCVFVCVRACVRTCVRAYRTIFPIITLAGLASFTPSKTTGNGSAFEDSISGGSPAGCSPVPGLPFCHCPCLFLHLVSLCLSVFRVFSLSPSLPPFLPLSLSLPLSRSPSLSLNPPTVSALVIASNSTPLPAPPPSFLLLSSRCNHIQDAGGGAVIHVRGYAHIRRAHVHTT